MRRTLWATFAPIVGPVLRGSTPRTHSIPSFKLGRNSDPSTPLSPIATIASSRTAALHSTVRRCAMHQRRPRA